MGDTDSWERFAKGNGNYALFPDYWLHFALLSKGTTGHPLYRWHNKLETAVGYKRRQLTKMLDFNHDLGTFQRCCSKLIMATVDVLRLESFNIFINMALDELLLSVLEYAEKEFMDAIRQRVKAEGLLGDLCQKAKHLARSCRHGKRFNEFLTNVDEMIGYNSDGTFHVERETPERDVDEVPPTQQIISFKKRKYQGQLNPQEKATKLDEVVVVMEAPEPATYPSVMNCPHCHKNAKCTVSIYKGEATVMWSEVDYDI